MLVRRGGASDNDPLEVALVRRQFAECRRPSVPARIDPVGWPVGREGPIANERVESFEAEIIVDVE